MLKKLSQGFGISFKKFKGKTKNIKREIGALYLAYKRKEVPIYTKIIIMIVVAYALSPIDLIPDFIPILGYVDDLVILPLGIALAVKLIPKDIMDQCRNEAEEKYNSIKKKSYIFAAIIILLWIIITACIIIKIKKLIHW